MSKILLPLPKGKINFSCIMRHRRLLSISIILGGLIIKYLFSFIFFGVLFPTQRINVMSEKSLLYQCIVGLILAPVFETFLCQFVPIELFQHWKQRKFIYPIIISAIVFSLFHLYTLSYFLYAFIIGLYLACVYIFLKKMYDNSSTVGFLFTIGIHFLLNASNFFLAIVMK